VKRSLIRLAVCSSLAFVAGLVPAVAQAQATGSSASSSAAAPAHKTATASTATHTDPALLHPATLKAQAPAEYDVKFVTTAGDFVVHVKRDSAPIGADRFWNLVKHGYFNNAAFFRVVPGFVVQFGLSANPAVNKAWEKANLQDDPVKESNHIGTLTFATAGANTRTTQLFINLAENPRLDQMGFAPFGTITSGMDVVQKIYAAYGETPDQNEITEKGKPYLDKNFPKLDVIKATIITSPVQAAAPVHHSTTAPAAKKPAAAAAPSNQ
jgi:peptidyl-prolyl cis-trans isomerase A (cyclophilin A)